MAVRKDQFGFHWNNSRKCWQHPCGAFRAEGSGQDPRQKYGCRQVRPEQAGAAGGHAA
jgi:hypothetical protein